MTIFLFLLAFTIGVAIGVLGLLTYLSYLTTTGLMYAIFKTVEGTSEIGNYELVTENERWDY